MNNKLPIELIKTDRITTAKELALYIIGIVSQNDWCDGACLDYIMDACYNILGTKDEIK